MQYKKILGMFRSPLVGKALWVLGVVVLMAIVSFLCLRNLLLNSYFSSKTDALKARYGVVVSCERLYMSGLSVINIREMSVVPENGDTLLSVRSMRMKLKPLKMLLLNAALSGVDVDELKLCFIKGDSLSNYDFLYQHKATNDTISRDNKSNYVRRLNDVLDFMFDIIPSNASVRNLSVIYKTPAHQVGIDVPSLVVDDNRFDTRITTIEDSVQISWTGRGVLNSSQRVINASLCAEEGKSIILPLLEYKFDTRVQFDTISFELAQRGQNPVVLEGVASVSGLKLYNPRISPSDVVLDRGAVEYRFNIDRNSFELDSATKISFNKLTFNPYLKLEHNHRWRVVASVNKSDFDADDLFSSIPQGLFFNIDGLRTSGKLSYHFLLDLDMEEVDSLKFESSLKRNGFRILSYGNTDLRLINAPFTYSAYQNGVLERSFEVGEGNPWFRPLNAISPTLRMAVMQSEDGAFFDHNGFLIDCMRAALIEDIKQRKFVRGGSTISMQLVKNVFLSRNKTIARKLEEAMIVWLIESNRLSSKERMFEVYLNIAEWGQNIYGIAEAAHYYFDKEPLDLDVNESIFLASIIPSPKSSLRSFDDNLQLKPYFEGYYRLLAERLVVRESISADQAASIRPSVELKGRALDDLKMRMSADTSTVELVIDSLLM